MFNRFSVESRGRAIYYRDWFGSMVFEIDLTENLKELALCTTPIKGMSTGLYGLFTPQSRIRIGHQRVREYLEARGDAVTEFSYRPPTRA